MLGYKKILIATDLSPHGQVMLKGALEIAKSVGADVYMIHVLEQSPLAFGGEFSVPLDGNMEQKIEVEARTVLEQIAQKFGIDDGHLHLSIGSVKLKVTEFAKKINADLIVVGAHGHNKMDLLLGSHANAILHKAGCDVWVFKNKEK